MLLWLNAVSSPVGKKKKSIDLHCIQVKVEISECFRQIKKKNFVRVYTTKGGWDDCTPMNWPFNFKPASLEVTPQIVSVIKSPFPNPSVLAKTFFWGGQAFVSRVLSIQCPCSVADGPSCVHTWTDVQPFKLSPCPFCPSEHLTKKKKKKRGTHPLLPDSPPVLQLLVTDWIQWPRYDGGKNPGETWILPLMKLPRYVYLFL